MGDGLVVEQGTHNELLQTDGAYARLVQAQKLREQRPILPDDDSATSVDEPEDMEKLAREEVPLGRKNTGHSLASDILEQKRRAAADEKEKGDLSLVILFIRMGKLIRTQWNNYFFGAVFASSMCLLLLFYLSNMGSK
jgi:ATP-binding cassette subfamily B (MDR/TAP) protein 1